MVSEGSGDGEWWLMVSDGGGEWCDDSGGCPTGPYWRKIELKNSYERGHKK